MKRSPTTLRLAALASASALVLAACGGGGDDDSSSDGDKDMAKGDGEFVVGSLLPQTGSLAFLGPPEFAGVDLAVKEINEAGGVLGKDAKHVKGDSGDTDSGIAPAEADKLIKAGADVIVGAASSGVSMTVIDKIPAADPSAFAASPGKAPDVETLLAWISDLPPRTPGGFPDSIGALSNGILRNAAMRMTTRRAGIAAPGATSAAVAKTIRPIRAATADSIRAEAPGSTCDGRLDPRVSPRPSSRAAGRARLRLADLRSCVPRPPARVRSARAVALARLAGHQAALPALGARPVLDHHRHRRAGHRDRSALFGTTGHAVA